MRVIEAIMTSLAGRDCCRSAFRLLACLVMLVNPTGHGWAASAAASLEPFVGALENRVAPAGRGTYDSYWRIGASGGACTLALFTIVDQRPLWSTDIADCSGFFAPPVFYTRSFMGDAKRDFTVVVRPASGVGHRLLAGDGATGALRDFSFDLSNAARGGIVRVHGTAVVDFKIPKYPGPALFVRGTGGGSDQRGHLFYFPSGSRGYVDVTEDPEVIDKARFKGYPFPGVDIAAMQDGRDLYTVIYDDFNAGDRCVPFKSTEAPGACGVPDGDTPASPVWNRGNGNFLDKVAVADVDGDGVDDLLLTYLWRSVVYPGRPKGQAVGLGAPMYDAYYNPQDDASGCHSGRHYGLSALLPVAGAIHSSTVDIAGTPVGQFSDPLQNVSRNIAVVATRPGAAGLSRALAWNIPFGTSIPGCRAANLYSDALHYPADGLIRESEGRARFVQVNRWTQLTPAVSECKLNDLECYGREQATQTGFWTWEVRSIEDGQVRTALKNAYVWDCVPIIGSPDCWILYSSDAARWNLDVLRDDLVIARLDAKTLRLSGQQKIVVPARPFLKSQHWQNVAPSVSSNWPATRLFTLDLPDGRIAFVLHGSSGNLVFFHDGKQWRQRGQ